MPKERGKTVWVVFHDAARPEHSRHTLLAEKLREYGFTTLLIAASTVHNSRVNLLSEGEASKICDIKGVPALVVRTRPYQANDKDRILNMLDFYSNVLKSTKEFEPPDIVIASSPQPLALLAGIKLAKRYECPCICEVRDLYPESPIEYGYLKRDSVLAKVLYRAERWAYEQADALVFTMEGGADYICSHGWDKGSGGRIPLEKVHYINNGVDLELFDARQRTVKFEHPALQLEDSAALVVYAGSIRKANNIGFLVDAAALLSASKVKFLILGDGDERASLERRCANESIDNVVFTGKVGKEFVPSALAHASILLLHSKKQEGLSRYGMSQNKLSEYLAAGKPILSSLPSGYSVINRCQCGYEGAFESPEDFAEKLIDMLGNPEQLATWGINARKAAGEFDFNVLARKYDSVINDCIGKTHMH